MCYVAWLCRCVPVWGLRFVCACLCLRRVIEVCVFVVCLLCAMVRVFVVLCWFVCHVCLFVFVCV